MNEHHSTCLSQGDDDGEMTSEIERKFEMTAEKAHEILRRISDEDCEALGFNVKFSRPDWMILTVLPVPPPPVRPSVMMDSSARCVSLHHNHNLASESFRIPARALLVLTYRKSHLTYPQCMTAGWALADIVPPCWTHSV